MTRRGSGVVLQRTTAAGVGFFIVGVVLLSSPWRSLGFAVILAGVGVAVWGALQDPRP